VQTAVSRHESRTTGNYGIVYRTICRNPGCGFKFDLRVTPENASLLSRSMACPHCKRHGGNSNPRGASVKSFSQPSYCFARPGSGRRVATMTKWERTPATSREVLRVRSFELAASEGLSKCEQRDVVAFVQSLKKDIVE